MKYRFLRTHSLFLLSIISFIGCKQENIDELSTSEGIGYLKLQLDIGIENQGGRLESISTDTWNVIIYDTEDLEVRNFPNFSELPSEIPLAAGDYTIFISSEDQSVGFDNPYYTGTSEVFTIKNGDIIPITVTAELSNVQVSVSYSPEVIRDFTAMFTTISSASGVLIFGTEETRSGYFIVGEELTISADLTFTRSDLTTEVRSVSGTITNTVAKDHFIITIDYTLEHGVISPLTIIVDSTTNDIPVLINERPTFTSTYGGSLSDLSSSLEPTSDYGYVFCAITTSTDGDLSGGSGGEDGWILKADNTGAIQWSVKYGGTNIDHLYDIQETSDGGFIAVGRTNSSELPNHRGSNDAWVLKVDGIGNTQWQTLFGSSITEELFAVIQSTNDSYIVAGLSMGSDGDITDNQGGIDLLLAKLDDSGNLLWLETYGGPGTDVAYDLKQTFDNGFIIAGFTTGAGGDVAQNQGGEDVWAIKTDASGRLIWEQSFGSSGNERAFGVDLASDGGFYLAGHSSASGGDVSENKGHNDFWIVKLDQNGSLVWEKSFGGSSNERALDIASTKNGNLIIAGHTNSTDGDVSSPSKGNQDIWVIKLNDNGILLWEKVFGGSSLDQPESIIELPTGGIGIGGFSQSANGDIINNRGSNDAFIIVVDENGNSE